jgi:hypothetical protein
MIAAGLFAVAAISGAYVLATGAAAPNVAQASGETALLGQIATKDSTGDGLPDWEKALYGIPLTATTTDYFNLGMTDGEAVAKGLIVPIAATPGAPAPATSVTATDTAASFGLTAPSPGSLTNVFAQNFFALYTSAEQSNSDSLSDDQINDLATEALTELQGSVTPAPDFMTAREVKVSGTGGAAMRAYAANAEAVFAAHSVQLPESELQYLQDYLNGNTTTLASISQIATAYTAIATGLAALSVPQEAASTHLALVNALARIGETSTDFSNVDTDPLAAMLALQLYPQDVTDLNTAFQAVAQEFANEGLTFAAGTPGASFVNVTSALHASATATPPAP